VACRSAEFIIAFNRGIDASETLLEACIMLGVVQVRVRVSLRAAPFFSLSGSPPGRGTRTVHALPLPPTLPATSSATPTHVTRLQGSHYYLDEQRLGQGREAVAALLAADAGMRASLTARVRAAMAEGGAPAPLPPAAAAEEEEAAAA
jgi:hypothetical protein